MPYYVGWVERDRRDRQNIGSPHVFLNIYVPRRWRDRTWIDMVTILNKVDSREDFKDSEDFERRKRRSSY